MSRVAAVAWRDFKQTVMTKAFLFAIIGVPILIVGGMVVFGVIMSTHREPPLVGTIAVVDPTGELTAAVRYEFDPEEVRADAQRQAEAVMAEMQSLTPMPTGGPAESIAAAAAATRGEIRIEVERVDDPGPKVPEGIRDRVRSGGLLAVALAPELLPGTEEDRDGSRSSFYLLVGETVDSDHVGLIERRLAQAVVRVRAEREGLDADEMLALLQRPRAETSRVTASGKEASENEGIRAAKQFLIPMAFMILLWGSTFSSGQHLLMSTIEEKSNKVMEVLLSAVSPMQLMAGKIIGQGLVGLLVMGVYSILGITGLVAAAQADLIQPAQLVYLAVFFFMAYFMVASMMAAIGSAVSDIREANSLMMPVMIILMFPLMLWMPISQAPNGTLATIFSFVPPAIPFVMAIRVAAEESVPAWQIAATILWGYVAMIGMVWMSARIFRVGILMQGKPPSPIELLKWIRYS